MFLASRAAQGFEGFENAGQAFFHGPRPSLKRASSAGRGRAWALLARMSAMARSFLALKARPARSASSTLYRPVSVKASGCLASTRLRWASIASARSAMRWRSSAVRPVSSPGKGKVSKQRVLL
ncbi:hypothetical protein [Thiomonas sp.]